MSDHSDSSRRCGCGRRRGCFTRWTRLGWAGFILGTALNAQTPPTVDPAVQITDQLQREQLERQREELRRQRESAAPPAVIDVPVPTVDRPSVSNEFKRDIRVLEIEGAEHMREKFRERLERDYTGRIGASDVEALLTEITRHYVLRGFATTRAYLPEQDLSTGRLRIVVVEGRIERITGVRFPDQIFPTGEGDMLQLRKLEQGIDNLNRLPSNQAALDLQPGTEAGETIVAVQNTPGRRWRLNGSYDNTGSRDTGRDQASLTLSTDDLLGLTDSFSVSHRRAVPYHSGEQASQSTTASLSAPWGWQRVTLGGSTSSYASTFNAPSGTPLLFDGSSNSVFLRVDRMLYRDQTSQLQAAATLTWRSSKSYLLGNLIGVSSRDMTNLEATLDYSTVVWGGAFSAGAGLGIGLPIFGGLEDPAGNPDYAPHAEYVKGIFNVSYSHGFTLFGRRFQATSSLNGQYSPEVLYGSDQLTAGGLYSVRGFDKTSPAGDSGYVWRNDVSVPLAFRNPLGPWLGSTLGVRPYVGVDQGRVWSSVDGLPPAFVPAEGALAGAVGGVAFSTSRGSVDLSYQRAFDRPPGVASEGGRFVLRVALSY